VDAGEVFALPLPLPHAEKKSAAITTATSITMRNFIPSSVVLLFLDPPPLAVLLNSEHTPIFRSSDNYGRNGAKLGLLGVQSLAAASFRGVGLTVAEWAVL
jgi:hypothetical protein